MLKRITWISWLALGLLIIGILSVFLINPSIPKETPFKYNHNKYNILYLPLSLLSSVTFIMFLIKSKSMPKDQKKSWLFFSVASFSFFTTLLLNSMLIAFTLRSYESFIGILISQGITWIGILSMVLIFIGFDSEASKEAWKDRKTIMWPFYLALAIVFFLSMSSWITWPFGEILSRAFAFLLPTVFCIRVIKLARNEPISLCYKIILAGFIFDLVCSMVNVPLRMNFVSSIIIMFVNLFCVIVATDIRTQIWLDEQT